MRKLLTLAMVLSVLLIAAPVSADPGTLYVDDDGLCGGNSPCYTHPQDAVNAANPGDTILVYPGTYDSRFFEVQKYLTLTGHMAMNLVIIIHEGFYQKLSPELQQIVTKAAITRS